MSTPTVLQTRIDAYLAELRTRLRSLPEEQIADIVQEIRSHIHDVAAVNGALTDASVSAALDRLGVPSALAASYVTDNFLDRAERSHMPWTVLRGAYRWATLSAKGVLVFITCLIGYCFGASFFIAALARPFSSRVGLWQTGPDSYSLALGITDKTPPGHELLGWTLVPIGLALGGGTIMATTQLVLWFVRRFRHAQSLQQPNLSS